MNWLCKIFGHDMNSMWAGSKGGPFGAVVVNVKECKRCGKREYDYTTKLDFKDKLTLPR